MEFFLNNHRLESGLDSSPVDYKNEAELESARSKLDLLQFPLYAVRFPSESKFLE